MTVSEENHPLSAQQSHVWQLIQRGAHAYAQAVFEVDGPLDETRLRAAAELVTLRHEALRTHYERPLSPEALPRAVVQRRPRLLWETRDVRNLPRDQQRRAVEEAVQHARDERSEPGPHETAWRGVHFVFEHGRHAIVVTTNLLTTDSRAFEVLLRDLAQVYGASPPQDVLQYGQFVQWQRELAEEESEAVADADALWERRSSTSPLPLPRLVSPGSADETDGTSCVPPYGLPLEPTVISAAEELAQRCGVRLEAVFLAAWHVLLWQLSGQGATTVATAFPGRKYSELEDCLGHVAKWVGVRARAREGVTFEQVVSAVDKELAAVEGVEDCLIDSYATLAPPTWIAAFECKRETVHEVGALAWRITEDTAEGVAYDIKLECVLGSRAPRVVVRSRPGRFERAEVRSVAARYVTLLDEVLADPALPSGQRWLTGSEPPRAAEQTMSRKDVVEPRDAVEAAVVEVYEELLGIRPVGVEDDFFDLGGHSLLAAQLIARVGSLFRRELPVSVLFEAPEDDASRVATPRHLAGLVRNPRGQEDLAEDPLNSNPSSCLVPLRRGDGTPLFCVHPAGGDLTGFRDFVRTPRVRFPVYGLQPPAYIGDRAEQSVEQLASTYLDEIRAFQPHGPFHILGWSMGGLVAFETAHQLTALGEDVAMVTLVETYPAECLPTHDTFGIVTGVAEELNHLAGRTVVSDLEVLSEKPIDEGIDALFRQAETNGFLLTDRERTTLLRQLHFLRAHVRAAQEYQLREYYGPITLIQAVDEDALLRKQAAQVWREASRRPIELYALPGGHFSLLREPHVRALSRILERSQVARETHPETISGRRSEERPLHE